MLNIGVSRWDVDRGRREGGEFGEKAIWFQLSASLDSDQLRPIITLSRVVDVMIIGVCNPG